jgi:hypothetical protein
VIQAGGAIEFQHERRQFHAEPPFVGASACGLERLFPASPPLDRRSRERLDNEDAIARLRTLEQARQQRRAPFVAQLVDGEGRENQGRRLRERDEGRVGAFRLRVKAELAIGAPLQSASTDGGRRRSRAASSGTPRPTRRPPRPCRSRDP